MNSEPVSPEKPKNAVISVEAALEIVLASVPCLPVVELPLEAAIGLTLARAIAAPVDLPGERLAAMDGYAIRAEGVTGGERRVIGATMAGEPVWNRSLAAGEAIRIMTGAPVPLGADTVVPIEDTDQIDAIVRLNRVVPGANIRNIGSDITAGTRIASAGEPIDWATTALLISFGIGTVRVHRRPKVAVISTGDELEASIPDSNGPMLAELLRSSGVDVQRARAADDLAALEAAIATDGAVDAYVISGGVSAGDRDVVRQFLNERTDLLVNHVRMKPGRPFSYALLNRRPFFALPGTPFAAAVTCLQFVVPALDRMQGRTIRTAERVEAGVDIDNPGHRRLVVPVHLDAHRRAAPLARGVAGLGALALASGLLVIPESVSRVEPGDCHLYWPIKRAPGEGNNE